MKLHDVARNYDRLAPAYDFFDRWLVQPLAGMSELREQTVACLDLEPGQRVLDIGCGTGLNLPLLVERVGPEGQVVGLDYSGGMLRRAQSRMDQQGWQNVELVQGDAARLDGVGAPFDAVMSTWTLGIVDDLDGAIVRALEVLKPGGKLAVLDLHRSRSRRGPRRWVDPLIHWVLRASGVDSAEDLDDERLQKRWTRGRTLLREGLVDVEEQINVSGSGFLLWGRKPV